MTLGAAIDYLGKMDKSKRENYRACIQFVDNSFKKLENRVQIYHSETDSALGVWSFSIAERHPGDLADLFSEKDICLRSGHHCCEPFHRYIGISGTVRMSIGYETTLAEVEQFFAVLQTLL